MKKTVITMVVEEIRKELCAIQKKLIVLLYTEENTFRTELHYGHLIKEEVISVLSTLCVGFTKANYSRLLKECKGYKSICCVIESYMANPVLAKVA